MIDQWSWEDQKTVQWIVFATNALLYRASGAIGHGSRKVPVIDEDQVRDLQARSDEGRVSAIGPSEPADAEANSFWERTLKLWGGM